MDPALFLLSGIKWAAGIVATYYFCMDGGNSFGFSFGGDL